MSKQISLFTNYFSIDVIGDIYKYDIIINEELDQTEANQIIVNTLFWIKENKQKLTSVLGYNFLYLNNSIYSMKMMLENLEFKTANNVSMFVQYDSSSGPIKQDTKSQILGRIIKLLQKKLRLKQVGRKLFDIKQSQNLKSFEIWPGFSTSFSVTIGTSIQQGLLNVDLVHKVITNQNVLELMDQIRQKSPQNYEHVISQELIGKSVMTIYNRKIYKIDKVDFQKCPLDSFQIKEDQTMPFINYYQDRYQLKINNTQQPLLIHLDQKKNETVCEIHLIPELCVLTGLSEQHWADFGLMKELDQVIQPQPNHRLAKCQELIQKFKESKFTQNILEDWQISISNEPVSCNGTVMHPGALIFGDKNLILDQGVNLQREGQGQMFDFQQLQKVVIFAEKKNQQESTKLKEMLTIVFQQYKINFEQIKEIFINQIRNEQDCFEAAERNLGPDVSLCFWILPGKKNAGINYDKIKRFMLNELPVPSQMILVSTIQKDKGFRSVVNKMVVQVGAKLGFIPWAINDLPFTDQPSIVVGIDISSGNTQGKVLGFTATTDPNFSQYFSLSEFVKNNTEEIIYNCFKQSFEHFKDINGVYPQRVIVFWQGVSTGERTHIKQSEVGAIRKLLCEFESKDLHPPVDLLFVCVNKMTNMKLYYNMSSNTSNLSQVKSPNQGTYISKNISSPDNEFFLVSQQTLKGLATPSSYFIMENDLIASEKLTQEEVKNMLAQLTFKLCFLYYNTIGGIKTPAPVHYANKLSSFIKQNSTNKEIITPHEHLRQIQSLYFI